MPTPTFEELLEAKKKARKAKSTQSSPSVSMTFEELKAEKKAKRQPTPKPTPVPVPDIVSISDTKEESLANIELDEAYDRALEEGVRREILYGDGKTPRSQIARDVEIRTEKEYGIPETPGFDKIRAPIAPANLDDTGFLAALRPQIQAGPAARTIHNAKTARIFPAYEGPADTKAEANHAGLTNAYNKLLEENPDAPHSALMRILQDEIEALPDTMQGKGEVWAHKINSTPKGLWSEAVGLQATDGSIPNLSPAQIAYLNDSTIVTKGASRKPIEEDVRANYKIKTAKRFKGEVFEVESEPTEEQVQDEIVRRMDSSELPWWATDKKDEILENFEDYSTGGGLFATKYPTGAVVESPVNWLFRAALSVPNAAVGGLSGLAEKTGILPAREDAKTAAGREDDGIFADAAYNVKHNRSLTEELGEMWSAQAMLPAWPGYLAGFGADMLMPLDMGAHALGRAVIDGWKVGKVSKALTGKGTKAFLQQTGRELAESAGLTSVIDATAGTLEASGALAKKVKLGKTSDALKGAGKQVRRAASEARTVLYPGDIRIAMGAEAGASMHGVKSVTEAIASGKSWDEAVELVAKEMGEESTFVKKVRTLNSAEDMASAYKGLEPHLKDFQLIVDDISRASRGANLEHLTPKIFKKWITIIARSDSNVESLLRGKTNLTQMMKAIASNPQANAKLMSHVRWEQGMKAVADMTNDWEGIARGLVLVTPKTWVQSKVLPKILDDAYKGVPATIASRLKEEKLITKVVNNESVTGWAVKAKRAKELSTSIRGYVSAGMMGAQEGEKIIKSLDDGFLATQDLRKLINADIDVLVQSSRAGLSEEIVSRLDPVVVKQLELPMERRAFTSSWFHKNVVRKIFDVPVPSEKLSLVARRELKSLTKQISSLDKKLRTDIKVLKKSDEVRALYGLEAGKKYSDKELLLSLMLGKVAERTTKSNQELFRTILDYFALYLKKTPSTGSVFKQTIAVRSNQYLTEAGAKKVNAELAKMSTPTIKTIERQVQEFLSFVKKGIADGSIAVKTTEENPILVAAAKKRAKKGKKPLVDPENKPIAGDFSYLDEKKPDLGKSKLGQIAADFFQGEKNIPEMLAAVYYQTEARRAFDKAITNITDVDSVDVYSRLFANVTTAELKEYELLAKSLGAKFPNGADAQQVTRALEPTIYRLILNRATSAVAEVSQTKSTLFKRAETTEEILRLFKSVGNVLETSATSDAIVVSLILEHEDTVIKILDDVDDIVSDIVRRNGLVLDNVSTVLEDMSKAFGFKEGAVDKATTRVNKILKEQEASRLRARTATKNVNQAKENLRPEFAERSLGEQLIDAPAKEIERTPAQQERLAARLAEQKETLRAEKQVGDNRVSDLRQAKSTEASHLQELEELPMSDEIKKQLQQLTTGMDQYALIREAFIDSKHMKNLESYIERLHRTPTSFPYFNPLDALSTMLRKVNDLRYHAILGWRPRFHGNNAISAPMIIMSTLGGHAATGAVRNIVNATDIIVTGLANPASHRMGRVVVTDPAGRAWSARELFTLALENGAMRSQASFQVHESMIENVIDMAKIELSDSGFKQFKRGVGKVYDAPLNAAEHTDNAWRMSVIIDSLKKGEDISIALEKGRVSMYDYGTLTETEKWWSTRLFMFYTFQRIAITEAMQNLVANPGRFKNALMIKKDIGALMNGASNEDMTFYAPDWAASKPILDFTAGLDKGSYYKLGPGIPTLDAASTIIGVLAAAGRGDMQGVVEPGIEMLSPELKMIFDQEKDYSKDNIIDPRDVTALHIPLLGLPMWSMFESLVGEVPLQAPAVSGESTYEGKRWTLSTAGYRKYKQMKVLSNRLGLSTMTNDWAQIFGTFDSSTGGRQTQLAEGFWGVAELIGGMTEVGSVPPSRARTFAAKDKTYRIKDDIKDFEKVREK